MYKEKLKMFLLAWSVLFARTAGTKLCAANVLGALPAKGV